MALDFPTSPTDGQIYDNYYWDNTNSVWRLLGDSLEVPANFSNTATGTYTDGFDYKYVSFTADGVLTVTRGGYADVLLVGGGGAGAQGWGGGGGAGGHLYIENAYLPAGSLDVVVGAGGVAVNNDGIDAGNAGPNGEPSSLWRYFVPGGGGGVGFKMPYSSTSVHASSGKLGGSGGGASGYSSGGVKPGGSGVVGIGNDGGTGAGSSGAGGGGGGAGAPGTSAVGTTGGNGGDGASNSITGSAVTRAGGGGGASSATAGTGGSGGGGAGAVAFAIATSGTANTGGGGGGAWNAQTTVSSGAGGSGIVIVRVRTN